MRPLVVAVLLGTVVGALVLRVLQSELAGLVVRQQLTNDALRLGFVVVSAVGSLVVALTLFVAPSTRVPGAATGVSLVVALLATGYEHVRSPGFSGPHPLVWVVGFALVPLVLDLTVAAYAGRPLPLPAVLLGAVAVAVLEPALSLGQQLDYVGGVANVVRDPYFAVETLVIGPVVLLGGAWLGWLVGLRWSPRSFPEVG